MDPVLVDSSLRLANASVNIMNVWEIIKIEFAATDKALIKNQYLVKGSGSRRLISESPGKDWVKGDIDTLTLMISQMFTLIT